MTFGGEHPHTKKQGFVNPGSTLPIAPRKPEHSHSPLPPPGVPRMPPRRRAAPPPPPPPDFVGFRKRVAEKMRGNAGEDGEFVGGVSFHRFHEGTCCPVVDVAI